MAIGNFGRMAEDLKKKIAGKSEQGSQSETEPSPIDLISSEQETTSVAPSAGSVMVSRIAESETDKDARIISLKLIDADPDQPRSDFRDIEEKAETILAHGLLHPIIVRHHPDVSGRFMIIDGERRWRAYSQILSKQDPLEFSEIRATVKADVQDIGKLRLVQLLANIQRDELNPIEEAEALAKIKELNNFKTNKELAKAVGKSETRVSRSLKLLQLSSDEKAQVVKGELSARDIQNKKGVIAARDGTADKTKKPGESGAVGRVSKVSISMDTAVNLALILQKLADQKGLASVALSDKSKKELITVLEARAGDILGSL